MSCTVLGGRLKTGNLSTPQDRQLSPAAETTEFYLVTSSVRTLELRGSRRVPTESASRVSLQPSTRRCA